MPLIEIDVGPFPREARTVVLDYADRASPLTFVRLGETAEQVSRWSAPEDAQITLRARFRDRTGRIRPGIETPYSTALPVDDRPAPADLTMPAAVVKQDGPALEIVQDVPQGVSRDEYQIEVVQTPTADSSPKDGLHLGYVAPGEPLMAHMWPDDQKVWTRPARLEDGRTGDWTALTVTSATPTIDPAVGHSTAFASGTIGKLAEDSTGPAVFEVSGGDLRHKATYAGDLSGYAGDLAAYAGDLGLRCPGYYTTAIVDVGAIESVQFQVQPVLTSITRPTAYAGDWLWPAGGSPRVDVDGTIHDPRRTRDSFQTGGGDETALSMDVTVATSNSTGSSFSASDYKPLVPGKVYPDVREYAVRFYIRADYGRTVTLDKLYVWHWIWCRTRPWHTHSWAPELIYQITTAEVASVTASVALATWDEVRVEVDWKNADANPSQFRCRLNNDSGNNYYFDGAAAASAILFGGGTLAAGASETIRFTIRNPAAGAERRVQIEAGQRSDATTSYASPAALGGMWDNTADEIASIVFSATVGATPIASGTQIRIWGKRRI